MPKTPPLLYCEQLPRFTAVVVVARCVGFIQRLGHWLAGSWRLAGLGPGGFMRPACQRASKVEVLHASCWGYFIHAGCKRHITPQGAGVAIGPVKFVVGASRGRWSGPGKQVEDWTVCAYVCICGAQPPIGSQRRWRGPTPDPYPDPPPGPQGRPVTAVNKRRNTNRAGETRTLCPVGKTSLIPWV
jgi:hypothetical protein